MNGGFIGRMSRDTGSPVPVWLYMLEKVCHVSFMTIIGYTVFDRPMLWSAIVSAGVYLIISKIVVRFGKGDWSTFWRDGSFYRRAFFITITLSLVPLLVLRDWRFLLIWLVCWIGFEELGWMGT